MTDQCVLCGADGHAAKDCPWRDVVPEGFRLVPAAATEEMVDAGCLALVGSIGGYEAGRVYKCWESMLAATPSPTMPAEGGSTAAETLVYSSTQATKCAGCGQHKHTPLRIDARGGYVCLTCIDKELERLLAKPAEVLSDERTREIMLANGFTIKAGMTDLKPYVYAAARAIANAVHVPAYARGYEAGRAQLNMPPMFYQLQADGLDTDERAAFEAWAGPAKFEIHHKSKTGEYIGYATPVAWMAWQARAALTQQQGRDIALLLPGPYYMDPPDGGDASVFEQLRRMSVDAKRYQFIRDEAARAASDADWDVLERLDRGEFDAYIDECIAKFDAAIAAAKEN